MKYLFLLFFILSFKCYAQDKIVKNNGETIEVKIIKSTDDIVSFIYPNEDAVNEIYKNSINRIIYSSGRIEDLTKRTGLADIKSEKDWDKVVVTHNADEVKGLEKFKDVSKSSGWGGAMGANMGYNDVVKKLKKEAAKYGCRIVLITDNPSKHSAAMGGGVKLTATLYK